MWGGRFYISSSVGVTSLDNEYPCKLKYLWLNRDVHIDIREMKGLNRCGNTEKRENNKKEKRERRKMKLKGTESVY